MNKADLRTGIRVELRNGNRYVLLKDFYCEISGHVEFALVRNGGYMLSSAYNDDLTATSGNADWDVVKVFNITNANNVLDVSQVGLTVWKREPIKEMTVEEIQQALGYKIKVVEGK